MKKTIQFFFACTVLMTAFSFTTQQNASSILKLKRTVHPCVTSTGAPGSYWVCKPQNLGTPCSISEISPCIENVNE
jgi:hypothetical protein